MAEHTHYRSAHIKKDHEIKLTNRKKMEISGVVNVESFDNEEFLLETECGFMAIRGENLHMKNLNVEDGLVAIEGLVMELGYVDHPTGGDRARGFFSKLFK